MKSQSRFFIQITVGLFLLAALCSSGPELASAQTDHQTERQIPGVPAGYTIIEGDIQMPVSVVNEMRQSAQKAPGAPKAVFKTNLWPNGIVPFEFETNCAATSTCANAPLSGCVSEINQTNMLNAMAVLEGVANVDFQQCPNNNCTGNHIRVRDSTNDTTVGANNACQSTPGNNSAVGMQGNGEQVINIVSWETRFIIVHELLHALGFFHEQSRPDRDAYVDVTNFCGNVEGGCTGDLFRTNFSAEMSATAFGYYDFDSVMHYRRCAFSRNGNCPTVTPVFPDGGITISVNAPFNTQTSPAGIPWPQAIGQRDHLSAMDRASVSFLYPFADWRFVNCDYQGSNGPSDGSFPRPYANFAAAVANTPEGGTLWILNQFPCPAVGTYNKAITVRVAPGVAATLGE